MAVAASSWVTLAQFKVYCGLPAAADSTNDTLYETVIDAVSSRLTQHLGREIAKTTYTTVYIDGDGERDILLPHYPIVSITSIYEDDVLLTEGTDDDYILYASEGRLRRVGGGWMAGSKTVKLTYVAGYTVQGASPGTGEVALPGDLKLAALMQCAAEWKRCQQKDWGEASRSFPDGSVSKHSEDALLPQVKAALDRHMVGGE
jgi:hypothetical protein